MCAYIDCQMKLLAFHNKPEIKEKYLARVRADAAADRIVSGQYWERGKGCAVGCTIHGNDHAAYENELGIPSVMAHLEDSLFEGIYSRNRKAAKEWPERFLMAANVGRSFDGLAEICTLAATRCRIWGSSACQKSAFARGHSGRGGFVCTKDRWQ